MLEKQPLTVRWLAAGLTFAADPPKLQTIAKNADTPAAHSEVARGYLEWAKSLDEKAAKREAIAGNKQTSAE